MRAFRCAIWLALLLQAIFVQGAASIANAQGADATRAEAKRLFEAAVSDYAAARYDVALSGFQEAFRIAPHPLVRVNMANCYDKLGRPLEALFHFEQFLQADAGSPAQRKEVNAAVARLRKQVGEVQLRIAPDGAIVTIDKRDQRTAPVLDSVRLEAGTHALDVRLPGYRSVHREFTVAGGGKVELDIALEREAAVVEPAPIAAEPIETAPEEIEPLPEEPTPAPVEPASEADSESGVATALWVVGGVTVGLIVATTVAGIMALSADAEFEKQRDTANNSGFTFTERQVAYNKALEEADKANALALTTDILLGGAILGALGTTILLIVHLQEEPNSQTATLTPILHPKNVGLNLRASF